MGEKFRLNYRRNGVEARGADLGGAEKVSAAGVSPLSTHRVRDDLDEYRSSISS